MAYVCNDIRIDDWRTSGSMTSSTDWVWVNWVNASASSITYSTDHVWRSWTQGTSDCTTTSSATDTVWVQWVNTAAEIIVHNPRPVQPLTLEERRAIQDARLREVDRWKKVAEEEKALRIAAEARAEKLLLEHLSEPQQQQYRKEKKFRLITKSGKEYEVTKGWAGNVVLLEKGKPVTRFCIHPATSVPEEDNLLAQKLMLETNEQEFLRIANKTPLRAA